MVQRAMSGESDNYSIFELVMMWIVWAVFMALFPFELLIMFLICLLVKENFVQQVKIVLKAPKKEWEAFQKSKLQKRRAKLASFE